MSIPGNNPSQQATEVLSCTRVRLSHDEEYDTGMDFPDISLHPGDLMLVLAERNARSLPFCDAVTGLISAESGEIRFLGQPWSRGTAAQKDARRARIGRIFHGRSWLGNLDIDENIMLSQRFHTRKTDREIEEEAFALARSFGLEGLPSTRPAWTPPGEQQRAQWVRALIGKPSLLLAEFPENNVTDIDLESFLKVIHEQRAEGLAVAWFTLNPSVWNNKDMKAKYRLVMHGSRCD